MNPRRRLLLRIACAFVLAALIGYSYGPSFNHLPRADDWWYYLNALDTRTFSDTYAATYSYARTRTVMPGDEFIYRPLFFALLAFKKDVLGTNFALAQLIPLILHFAFCWIALLLLDRLRIIARDPTRTPSTADRFAAALVYALPAYLAVNAALIDAVIWTHITGYLLFYVLMIAVVYALLRATEPLRVSSRFAGIATALVVVAAAFVYEYGQFYAVILTPWALFWNRPLRDRLLLAAAFLAVPLVYQSANAIDKRVNGIETVNPEQMDLYTNSLADTLSPATFASIYRFVRYAGGVPMFPSAAVIAEKEERILIQELSVRRAISHSPRAAFGLIVLPLWIVAAAAGYFLAIRAREFRVPAIALTLAACFGLYALGISLVRVNPDAGVLLVLAGSSYYMYWPFALLSIGLTAGIFLLIGHARDPLAQLAAAAVSVLVVVYLALEGAASAAHLKHANETIAEQQAPARRIVESVNAFFDARPNARVAFDLTHSDVPDIWDLGVPLTTLLYRAHEDNFHPDFLLTFQDDRLQAAPVDTPAPAGRPYVPHLIHVGRSANVYLHEGRYYGLLRFEGRYDPRRTDAYRYLATGRSVAEVLAQELEMLSKRDHDVAAGRLRDRYWH